MILWAVGDLKYMLGGTTRLLWPIISIMSHSCCLEKTALVSNRKVVIKLGNVLKIASCEEPANSLVFECQ